MANIADVGGGLTAKEIQDKYLATVKANLGNMGTYGKTNTAINNAVSTTGPIGELKTALANQPTNGIIPTTASTTTPTTTPTRTPTPTATPSAINQQFTPYQTSPQFQQVGPAPNLNNIATPQYQAPKDDGINVMGYIDQLTQAQKIARMADLQKARDSSLSNLGAESAKIDPQYNNLISQASTSSNIGAKSFAEFMAARGQTNAGVAGQNEMNRTMGLQNEVGGLNLQRQNANNDIARRTTDVNNGYNSDVTSANALIDAEAFGRRIDQTNTDRSRADNLAQNSFQNAMASANMDMDKAYRTFTMDLQARGFNNDQIQQQWSNNFQATQGNNQNIQNQFSNAMDMNRFDYSKSRDALSDTRYADETAYSRLRDTISDTGKLSDGSYTQQGLLNSQSIAMNQENLREKMDPNSVTNQMARIGLDTAKLNYAALPAQLKGEATQLLQSLTKGFIDINTAREQLKEITDPKSIRNQTAALGLKTATVAFNTASAENKALAQKIIDEAASRRITLETAQKQLNALDEKIRLDNEATRAQISSSNRANQGPTALDNQEQQLRIDALKTKATGTTPSYVVSSAYAEYLKAPNKQAWLNNNVGYLNDSELKAFYSLIKPSTSGNGITLAE